MGEYSASGSIKVILFYGMDLPERISVLPIIIIIEVFEAMCINYLTCSISDDQDMIVKCLLLSTTPEGTCSDQQHNKFEVKFNLLLVASI